MNEICIRVKNTFEHKLMQRFLFDLGVEWIDSGKFIKNYQDDGIRVLFKDYTKKQVVMMRSHFDFIPEFDINDLQGISKVVKEMQKESEDESLLSGDYDIKFNKDGSIKIDILNIPFEILERVYNRAKKCKGNQHV